jgi:heme/copper-type cytochrome/quinol oxidase subunit 3
MKILLLFLILSAIVFFAQFTASFVWVRVQLRKWLKQYPHTERITLSRVHRQLTDRTTKHMVVPASLMLLLTALTVIIAVIRLIFKLLTKLI